MISKSKVPQTTTPAFVITREFNAPRDLVFQAWTEAEHLAHWWGPVGSTIHVEQLDLRPGGIFHYRLTTSEGAEMWAKFTYREVDPPERLVFSFGYADAEGNAVRAPFAGNFPFEILDTLTFTEHDGVTTLTLRGVPVEPTVTEGEMFESMFESMNQGFEGTFAKLDDYLEQLAS